MNPHLVTLLLGHLIELRDIPALEVGDPLVELQDPALDVDQQLGRLLLLRRPRFSVCTKNLGNFYCCFV
jgi:hypothetical protein